MTMLNEFSRTELLLGADAIEKLKNSNVAIFGIGGVGSYAVEALARSGIGSFELFDNDKVCITNINRQLIATHKTVGQYKVEVMKERILDINPNANVKTHQIFYTAENARHFEYASFSYIVDAIDTISSKLILIEQAHVANVPVISCMGAGNKLDPTMFEVADIYSTSICPLARVMRGELRKRNIDALKVVYSKEVALTPTETEEAGESCISDITGKVWTRRQIPGSVSFVPPVAGLIIAGEVVQDLIK